MEDDRIILLNNAGEPVGEEDDLNLTDPTGPFLRSINTTKTRALPGIYNDKLGL